MLEDIVKRYGKMRADAELKPQWGLGSRPQILRLTCSCRSVSAAFKRHTGAMEQPVTKRVGRVAWIAAGLLALVLLSSCSDRRAGISLADPAEVPTATPLPLPDPNPQRADDADAELEPEYTADGREIIRVDLPRIPVVELPPIGDLAETGQLAERRLAGLVTSTAISGVDVVAASCAAEGGELVYGDAGDDVFASDGSGRIVERSADGLTTLVVEADGSGEFYDEDTTTGSLVTVQVNADQSGEYFNQTGSLLTTILVNPDRTGEFFRGDDFTTTTLVVEADGSGEYFDQQLTGLLTISAEADGSGSYFFDGSEADLGEITLLVRRDGSWQLTDQDAERRIELNVEADGSGTYARRAFDPLVFDFDAAGEGSSGDRLLFFELPPKPQFSVAAEFPPLGKFGALNPPCATIIRFDAQLLFDFGESAIRPGAEATLDEVVATLQEIGKPIEVNGHTDSRGTDERNVELSLDRANAVLQELTVRGLSVPVEVNGFGESQPVAPNETPDGEDNPNGRALNRRVEIVIRE